MTFKGRINPPFFLNKIVSPSGKIYIGQTIDLYRRKMKYKGLRCEQQPKI